MRTLDPSTPDAWRDIGPARAAAPVANRLDDAPGPARQQAASRIGRTRDVVRRLAAATLPGMLIAPVAPALAADAAVLYGVLDVGVSLERSSDQATVIGLASGTQSGSRWGVRGGQDLGQGLRANYQLEGGVAVGTGRAAQGGRLFGRLAWAGLSAPLGELRLGRQASPASNALYAFDAFSASYLNAGAQTALLPFATHRVDNMAIVTTPAGTAWQASAGYSHSARNNAGDAPGSRVWSTALGYDAKPWAMVVTAERVHWGAASTQAAGMRASGANQAPLGLAAAVRWTGDRVTAYGAAAWTRHGALVPESPSPGQFAYFADSAVLGLMLGADWAVGPGRLMTSWQASLPRDGGSLQRRDATRTQHVVSLGYNLPLSKRTAVYGAAAQFLGSWTDKDWRATQMAVGVRHRF